ncbi:MAG: putative metal-binding motif-containing protein [Deltaproteobacteria bacterium]|nr:putative metal-binding motif-containing protein [Deltaproteobacteria bacterium]
MRPPAVLLACSLALGPLGPASCDSQEDDTAPEADTDTDVDTGPTDADGDGWTVADGDCDDHDPSVYPGAAETWYDGVDQDCSGGSDFDAALLNLLQDLETGKSRVARRTVRGHGQISMPRRMVAS